jgi:uncharacterized protein YecT (DUF1311 family)
VKVLALLLVAAAPVQAQAQSTAALEECTRRVAQQADVGTCLLRAQRAASDEMLALVQRVRDAADDLERVTGRPGPAAALVASQREFERYVDGQCRLVHAFYASGNGADQAALGCEVDLLRQRAAALRALLPAPR